MNKSQLLKNLKLEQYLNRSSPSVRNLNRHKPRTIRIIPIHTQITSSPWHNNRNPCITKLRIRLGNFDLVYCSIWEDHTNATHKWDLYRFLNLGQLEWDYWRNSLFYEQVFDKIKASLGYDYGGEGFVGIRLEVGLCGTGNEETGYAYEYVENGSGCHWFFHIWDLILRGVKTVVDLGFCGLKGRLLLMLSVI